ncbi:unnamed protein product [Larinioides sclopetarius]|uniref:Uncharacterized protein n=1 Tax=Larinioides sclopetarius TaxID=280406 RepID=A0AAV2B6G7_9ARAC
MAFSIYQRGISFSLQKFYKMSCPLTQNPIVPSLYTGFLQYSSRRNPDVSDIPELNEPPLKKFYEAYYQPEFGRVHDKKPFKIKCVKGKTYYWCVCGWSHDQAEK